MLVIYDVRDLSIKADDTIDVNVHYWAKTKSGGKVINIVQAAAATMQTEFQGELVTALAAEGITTTTGELRRLAAL